MYTSLPKFLRFLEEKGHLKRITQPVAAKLEITEISRRVLENKGPALLFETVIDDNGNTYDYPVVTNLYAHIDRICFALGGIDNTILKELGEMLSFLKQPTPPKSLKEGISMIPLVSRAFSMPPKILSKGECQEVVIRNPNLKTLPIQTCWPGDVSPLITWPIIVTKGPTIDDIDNYNLGIYRMQLLSENKLLMRWLKMRGGAQQYERWSKKKREPFPASVVIGTSPCVTMAAVMPLPSNLSEYSFAGLLAKKRVELVKCISNDLHVPANSEIILEGEVSLEDFRPEGPFGDHTGYYNDVELFPVFTVHTMTMRKNPVYLSTYTGKPPDEPSILGEALNEIFIPIIKQQFPDIINFWLPPEGCSYRICVVSIDKTYPGQAKRIMMGIWSFLQQFMYTKFIIVVDKDIDVKKWEEVVWAISTRADPKRDTLLIENTPIDYLDFASPVSGLGSKMGIDATNKIPPETMRNWGNKIEMTQDIIDKINNIWSSLGL